MAIYLVTRKDAEEGEKPRMVECRAKTQAISHVVGEMFEATPVDTKTAIAMTKDGVELEEIGSEE